MLSSPHRHTRSTITTSATAHYYYHLCLFKHLLLHPHATCWSFSRIINKHLCLVFLVLLLPQNICFAYDTYGSRSCRSALQVLHKACEVSRRFNYFPGGIALTWMAFYESCITSEQSYINEWNAMTDLETTRPESPTMFVDG